MVLAACGRWDSYLADMPVLREVALLALFSAITGLIGIPFSYYSTFHIEEKFGFKIRQPAPPSGRIWSRAPCSRRR